MDQHELASHLDLANHHPNATASDIENLCANVLTYGFSGAFVNPTYITLAKKYLNSKAKVGTAFSFPLGQDTLEMKVFAAKQSTELGADELDIVPNNGLLLTTSGLPTYESELKAIVGAARSVRSDIVVKFILETGLFLKNENEATPEEKKRGEELITQGALAIVNAGADFVKICSGMGPRGASINDVRVIKQAIADRARIKVAGGIDTLEEAQSFLAAGANRIGTSAAVKIIEEFLKK